ncbi:MAG: adenylosuccinate synthase [bacterium]|nr:adenylosuccinate synthase [bacterium]
MTNTIVLGMQWGDEGKGKIVDLICPAFDAVARYQGGHNAGHTVKFGDRHFALHFLPSGILQEGMSCVLGNGMVISPEAFFAELDGLREAGVEAEGRLFISDRAHVILPTHVNLDTGREETRGASKIGTTARGIGPAYETKSSRSGLRICELASSELDDRLRVQHRQIAPQLSDLGAEPPMRPSALAKACREWAERLAPYVRDTARLLNGWIDKRRRILFEGAQGALLDLDHGTYPFVTSSSSTAGGVSTGTGVPPRRIGGVLGVIKAYVTRVGGGPFVTELDDEVGKHLQERGNEVGTSTGRPRRCGWFDAVAARYAVMLNGTNALALTKLDVLDDLDEIKVCTGYRLGDELIRDFPTRIAVLEKAEPVYRTVPGWKQPTAGVLDFADLPPAARDYIQVLEEEVGVPVGLVSTGPRREETILVDRKEMRRLVSGKLELIAERRDAA